MWLAVPSTTTSARSRMRSRANIASSWARHARPGRARVLAVARQAPCQTYVGPGCRPTPGR